MQGLIKLSTHAGMHFTLQGTSTTAVDQPILTHLAESSSLSVRSSAAYLEQDLVLDLLLWPLCLPSRLIVDSSLEFPC